MLDTDYLVVGAGALGMTFVDQILTDSDASVIIVDKHHLPGGHWNDAYSFVRLHQPSAFYGVGSRELGSNRIDETGINAGFFEQASGAQVQSYFEQLMRERFLPSGRVQYFPLCEYREDGQFTSLVSGQSQRVQVRRKVVDGTFFNTAVPSTRPPAYAVAEGVNLVTPNQLPSRVAANTRYTVVGGGKTGMDVCVWLLVNGADPNSIRWIVPRDSWLINRETVQPGDAAYPRFLGARADQLEACAESESFDALFQQLESRGLLLRIDESVTPTMYHNATIAPREVKTLASIEDVVRLGRVQRIETERIVLDGGDVPASADDLYVDCTASAIARRDTQPVFEDGRITIQMIRKGLFCLSAASIAHVEATMDDTDAMNRLCSPMPAPDTPADWLRLIQADMRTQARWNQQESLYRWLNQHRLTGATLRSKTGEENPQLGAIIRRMRAATEQAESNLARLVSELD